MGLVLVANMSGEDREVPVTSVFLDPDVSDPP
jgi:hypothetical protein